MCFAQEYMNFCPLTVPNNFVTRLSVKFAAIKFCISVFVLVATAVFDDLKRPLLMDVIPFGFSTWTRSRGFGKNC